MIPNAASLFEKLPRLLRRHRIMTAWMQLTRESPLQLVRIRDNAFGYADMSDGFLRLIVIDQEFESNFFAVADRIFSKGGTFIDGGANHGLLSFGLAAKHGDRVDFHLFEPNPKLVSSIKLTSLRYPAMRLHLNPVAISDEPGSVSFVVNEGQTGASHIAESGEQGVEVPAITLDSYIDLNGIGAVELLKLDVEGFELPALRGATQSIQSGKIRAVYFEYFEKYLQRVGQPREVLDFLDSVGFEVCFCRPDNIADFGGPSMTFRHDLPGHGVPLRPLGDDAPPPMTDLMAVPREDLVALK